MTKVSVVIPTYNAKKYIGKCINSVTVGMTDKEKNDVEIIVVDDGSTDNSKLELERIEDKYKGNLTIVNNHHAGAGAARNKGIELASGKYIKFLDADDTLVPGTLMKMCDIADDQRVSLVKGDYNYCIGPVKIKNSNNWSRKPLSVGLIDISEDRDQIVTEYPNIGNKLFSRELIGDIRFPEQVKWEDLSFVPTVMAKSGIMYNMGEPVYNYRIHLNTTVSDFIKPIPDIYDIIKVLDVLKAEMEKNGLTVDYAEQIESLYIIHTLYRVENAMTWKFFSNNRKRSLYNYELYSNF